MPISAVVGKPRPAQPDPPGRARQVRRLLGLGASRVDIGQGEVPWDVLADPEGNEFCVLADAGTAGGLAAICLDAADPPAQGRFWTAATGWPVVDNADWGVSLRSVTGMGPALVMGPPVAPKSGINRLQLNLTSWPGADISGDVARLLEAGAVRVDTGHRETGPRTLADPEGNEFRVLKSPAAHTVSDQADIQPIHGSLPAGPME